jgi:uncharacterized protein YhaN
MFKRILFKIVDDIKYAALRDMEKRLSSINHEISDRDKMIKEKNTVISKKEKEIQGLHKNIFKINDSINDLLKRENNIKTSLNEIENKYLDTIDFGPEIPGAYGFYEPKFNLVNSQQYKSRLDVIRNNQKERIKSKEAIYYADWTVNQSKRDGNKLVNRSAKLALRAFNGECDAIMLGIKHYSKYDARKKRISNSYESINELLSILNMSIMYKYLQLKYEELDLVFEYEQKLQEEREAYRKQREIERDDQLARKDYERELKRIEKEQNHYENEVQKMKNELKMAASIEREKYELKIKSLLEKIEDLENDKKEFKSRFENKAGYVYIISNIGSFGENVYKIGTTRRLDPFDRINELCNASVPFRFDTHAVIFSNNCYELERELHNHFSASRLNKINNYKEYFRVSLSEIEEVCKTLDPTANFNYNPEGMEYQASLKLTKQLNNELSN